jgi:hypothetical protein
MLLVDLPGGKPDERLTRAYVMSVWPNLATAGQKHCRLCFS